MWRKPALLFILLATVALSSGCSENDNPVLPADEGRNLSAVLRGEIDGDLVDFEIAAKVGAGEDDPAAGALLVRGRNLAYDAAEGVLTVDLTLLNDGDIQYPEPVSLTFLHFLPTGVTVRGADNGETGPGAAFVFGFENDDAQWTPGEESLPRTAAFEVDPATSIGFVGRVDVDTPDPGGAIGGLVWHDADEDGQIGDGETGVGGVSLELHADDAMASKLLLSTMTAEDGTYRFDGLDAGFYTVVRLPKDGMAGTTAAEIAVLLVEADGSVSDFLLANFGVIRGEEPGDDEVQVGDYIQAKGDYMPDPHRLVPEILNVCQCDNDMNKHDDDDDGDDGDDCDDDDCEEDCDDGCRENACWGLLAGPVTGMNREAGYVEIMGTPVYFTEKCDWDDLERGPRVRVKAYLDDDGDVVACGHLKWWNGNRDRVSGFVQEIIRGDDDTVMGLVVLNTYIEIEEAPPAPTGTLGGVVFDDLDGDGVMDVGEPGIAGIGVALAGAAMDTVITDEGGVYAFYDLALGDYGITCSPVEVYVATTATTVRVALTEAEPVRRVNFGWMEEVVLAP